MSLLGAEDVYEQFTDNPKSLEGRLLFAVPKSESTTPTLAVTGSRAESQSQRGVFYKQHSIY
jgi:hypothetical protein